eukprot:403349901
MTVTQLRLELLKQTEIEFYIGIPRVLDIQAVILFTLLIGIEIYILNYSILTYVINGNILHKLKNFDLGWPTLLVGYIGAFIMQCISISDIYKSNYKYGN